MVPSVGFKDFTVGSIFFTICGRMNTVFKMTYAASSTALLEQWMISSERPFYHRTPLFRNCRLPHHAGDEWGVIWYCTCVCLRPEAPSSSFLSLYVQPSPSHVTPGCIRLIPAVVLHCLKNEHWYFWLLGWRWSSPCFEHWLLSLDDVLRDSYGRESSRIWV